MLKKTITYTDFNGDEVSEDFFFHLSKAELVEMELGHQGGLSAALERIVAAEDGKAIITEFKNIILSSYGQRSPDGKRFVKNAQIREEFESSEAYSVLFMDLVLNADSASEFVNGIIPQGMEEEMAGLAEKMENKPELAVVPAEEKPANPKIGDLWADKATGYIYKYMGNMVWETTTNLREEDLEEPSQ